MRSDSNSNLSHYNNKPFINLVHHMSITINRSLLFPRINESCVSNQKTKRAYQIRREILADITKKNQESVYNFCQKTIPVPTFLKRRKSAFKTHIQNKQINKSSTIRLLHSKSEERSESKKRNTICISDFTIDVDQPLRFKRIMKEEREDSRRRSLETIRNNLKMKILKFKTEINMEDATDRNMAENQQFKEFFSIRSLSKNIKAMNSLKNRREGKNLFNGPQKKVKIAKMFKSEKPVKAKINELKLTSIDGWIVNEEDFNGSLYEKFDSSTSEDSQ